MRYTKIKRKKSKINTSEGHQITREEKKIRKKNREELQKQVENN